MCIYPISYIDFIFFLFFLPSPLIKEQWNDKLSVAKNLSNFGLTNNPNKSILTGFINSEPQAQEEIKVQNKKVS